MRGIIYIARNDRHEDGIYKIGKTENFNIERRMDQLTNETSNLGKFYSKAHFIVDDLDFCESRIHKKLNEFRIQNNREFFKCGISKIIQEIKSLLGDKIKESFYEGFSNRNWIMDFVDECREKNYYCFEYRGGRAYGEFVRMLITKAFNELNIPDLDSRSYRFGSNINGISDLPNLEQEKVLYEMIKKLNELESEDCEPRPYEGFFNRTEALYCIYWELHYSIRDASFLNESEKIKLDNDLKLFREKLSRSDAFADYSDLY